MLPDTESDQFGPLSEVYAALAFIFITLFAVALAAVSVPTAFPTEAVQESIRLSEALDDAVRRAARSEAVAERGQSRIDELTEEAAQLESKSSSQAAQIEDLSSQVETLETEYKRLARSLQASALEICLQIDLSASMSPHRQSLIEDLDIFLTSIGVVASTQAAFEGYRSSNDIQSGGMRPIQPFKIDNGASVQAYIREIESIGLKSDSVDFAAASNTSFAMLDRAKRAGSKQVLLVLSDVSIFEQPNADADQVIEKYRDWLNADANRSVVVIFHGNTARDADFYRRLANTCGPRVKVSERPSTMLAEILKTVLD